MRPPQNTTIDGWVYTVKPLPAGQGLHLMTRLSKMLGRGVAEIVTGGGGGAIGRAIDGVLERADADTVVSIARELAAAAELTKPGGGKPASVAEVFDVHFAGDYLPLVDFLRFALEVNFGPFVAGLSKRLGRGAAAAE